jgi:hypothetical protein
VDYMETVHRNEHYHGHDKYCSIAHSTAITTVKFVRPEATSRESMASQRVYLEFVLLALLLAHRSRAWNNDDDSGEESTSDIQVDIDLAKFALNCGAFGSSDSKNTVRCCFSTTSRPRGRPLCHQQACSSTKW